MSGGIFDWSARRFFWVWTSFGPGLTGIEDGYFFQDGIHPHPLPGPIAEQLQLLGYRATEYQPDEVFSHWDGEGYRRTACFKKKPRRGRPPKTQELNLGG